MTRPVFNELRRLARNGTLLGGVDTGAFLLAGAGVLDGYRGAKRVSRERLIDLLIRVGALADDLPEVAELDLNPVIGDGDDLLIDDARIRIAPAAPRVDQMVRQLPL